MTPQEQRNSPNKELREEELSTDMPMSEKDEVKQAEKNTADSQQSGETVSVAADLKNREQPKNPDQHN